MEHDDFMIAVEVVERIRKGMTRDKACEEVAGLLHLSFERVVSIYSTQMKRKGAFVRVAASFWAVRKGK
jgi:hypothetical protein